MGKAAAGATRTPGTRTKAAGAIKGTAIKAVGAKLATTLVAATSKAIAEDRCGPIITLRARSLITPVSSPLTW